MTPSSSAAALAGSSLTASDNPTIHSDPSCPPPPRSVMSLASAGVLLAVAVAGVRLRRARMRRSLTSTTVVSSSSSSLPEMASASASAIAASSTAGRGTSTSSASLAASSSSDLAPFVASDRNIMRGSSTSATTVPSPPASVTAVLLSATSASSQQQQLADAPMTRSSSSAASAGSSFTASDDQPNLVLYYTVAVCFVGLTRYCRIHDHFEMAAAAGATAVAIVAVSLVLNERRVGVAQGVLNEMRRSSTDIARLEENAATAASAADEEAARLNGIIVQLEKNAATAATAASAADEEAARLNEIIAQLEENAATAASAADEEAARLNGNIARLEENAATAASASEMAAMMSANPAASVYSMHDLLPLVMFYDRNWEPLQQALQRERDDRLRVELTGPDGGGDPVHLVASSKNGYIHRSRDGSLKWGVLFDDDDTTDMSVPNFIATLAELELRAGGIVVLPLKDAFVFTFAEEDNGFDRDRDDEVQMGCIGFESNNGIRVYGRIGPIKYEDYINFFDANPFMTVPEFVQILENNRSNDPNDPVLLPQLDISSVLFPYSQINGILPLLQSMGVSTE